MSSIKVTTQAEFDAAWEKHKDDYRAEILIVSQSGVWIEVTASDSATVTASDSATVRAYGSATVTAYDSATVTASDSATVRAYGSATVTAYGSATVRAHDSATVTAHDSATVTAHDSATVTASDSATVTAYDSATVTASKFVAVHLHSSRVTVEGGVVIDVTSINLDDPEVWAAYSGATVTDGVVTLYKAVDDKLNAGHNYRLTAYPIGENVTAPDWKADGHCGHGLHASPHPHQALGYYSTAARMLEVTVPLASIRPLGSDKAKAQTVRVVREVSLTGEPLTEAGAR